MSQEVLMDSSNMNIINDGSVIIADDAEIFVPLEKIKVEADKAKYEKLKNFVTFTDNVLFNDNLNEVIIKSNLVEYEREKELNILF